MKCDDDIIKCVVFWTNLCLALVGISLLSIGIIYKITLEELSIAIPIEYQGIVFIPVPTLPLGTVLIVIAVLGCYGCLTEKINFIALYTVVLFVIFVLLLTAGIRSFFQLKDEKIFQEKLNLTLNSLFRNYHISYDNKEVVDLIQHRLKCCGFNGITDWNFVPKSCFVTDSTEVFKNPCPHQVFYYLKDCMFVIGTSVIALSVTLVAGFVISFFFFHYLMRKIRIRSMEFVCTNKDHQFDHENEL
ncbi:unnamed protein product [Phaedon cochleariae]|uniref:Tetraspanin n=1 Tax=Phaedon cochleariae TaxID=80249 RepID=A0A9P0DRV7_PHACE|nr:unnamed protein product [Phaedon cochleariae]